MGHLSTLALPSIVELFKCAERGIRHSTFNKVLIHVCHCLGRLPVSFIIYSQTLRTDFGLNQWQALICDAGTTNSKLRLLLGTLLRSKRLRPTLDHFAYIAAQHSLLIATLISQRDALT